MININGKNWLELTSKDIEDFILSVETEESFFFEFKDDKTSNKDLIKEISAFANTYGGYLFIGVSDAKKIEGCVSWNELRINTTIHDSITPIPSFDVRSFHIKNKTILVLRIDEGAEPPYITNTGKIYERISSSSSTIKDSIRLSQIYSKREHLQLQTEQKISIPPVAQDIGGIAGYIDIGFTITISDPQKAIDAFLTANYSDIANTAKKLLPQSNLTKVGNSLVLTVGGLLSNKDNTPSHLENYIEIIADGCAKMRLLLFENKTEDKKSVNMVYPNTIHNDFQKLYKSIMGNLFPKDFIYAKKYTSLTVLHQFHPYFHLNTNNVIFSSEIEENEIEAKITDLATDNKELLKQFGLTSIVANDRIPKVGLQTIDKKEIENVGNAYTKDGIIRSLFDSSFLGIGYPHFMLKNQ